MRALVQMQSLLGRMLADVASWSHPPQTQTQTKTKSNKRRTAQRAEQQGEPQLAALEVYAALTAALGDAAALRLVTGDVQPAACDALRDGIKACNTAVHGGLL